MPWAFVTLAYLLGCIPSGLIVARLYKVDLRKAGSGNIGATNALRVMGKKAGAVTLAGDMLKGALGAYLALSFAGQDAGRLAAVAAILGHDFPVFLGFKGGKGVATSFGVLLALEPYVALTGLAIWLVTVLIWRMSSLGALASLGLLPVWTWLIKGDDKGFMAMSIVIAALVIIKHRSNIARLIKGEESRIGRKAGIG